MLNNKIPREFANRIFPLLTVVKPNCFPPLLSTCHEAVTGSGSSNSPLLDRWGHLLGINFCQQNEMPQINYAIPVDTVTRIVTQIFCDGRTAQPFIGVTILGAELQDSLERELSNGAMYDRAVIMYVVPKSPAAGLVGLIDLSGGKHKLGDMIVGAEWETSL